MVKNSRDLLGKPVISLYDGVILGISNGLVFDRKLKKMDYLLLSSDKAAGADYSIRAKDLFAVSGDAITVKHSDLAVNLFSTPLALLSNDPSSSKVYTVRGNYLGEVKHVHMDEKYRVTEVATDLCGPLDLYSVATVNAGVIILQDKDQAPVALVKPGTRTIQKKVNSGQVFTAEEDVKLPGKAIINYEFLLGRRVKKDILLPNGRSIVKAGGVITANVLAQCRTYGRLLELTKNSQV